MSNILDKDTALADIMRFRAGMNLETSIEEFRLIDYSIERSKIYIMRDKATNFVQAYVIWADVIEETWQRYLKLGTLPIYSYEWNEGDIGLVIDVVFNPTYRLNILARVPEQFLNPKYVYTRNSKPYKFGKALKKIAGIKQISEGKLITL
ncbi:hypothetical protein N480_14170 [Pseudoalteromonas luteoviolacea S2607]|uniref:hypothetical protein n=1 Tax=Pseudoalteromonas luteoviolacea TaxID=43657 RepID=UPI0007B08475|nr:hypothetical protein [Pseudoalteromonas luteoviolacea]KZN37885.1 hypothetical protein N480_14170 [Pseudoalteromonas luteoviolacea S2607]